MMRIEVEITEESVDEVFQTELKDIYEANNAAPVDESEDIKNAVVVLLGYCMDEKAFKKWKKSVGIK
jgi:hypothetical protein